MGIPMHKNRREDDGSWRKLVRRAERKLVGQLWCAEGRYEQRTQFDDAVCTMIEGGRESLGRRRGENWVNRYTPGLLFPGGQMSGFIPGWDRRQATLFPE